MHPVSADDAACLGVGHDAKTGRSPGFGLGWPVGDDQRSAGLQQFVYQSGKLRRRMHPLAEVEPRWQLAAVRRQTHRHPAPFGSVRRQGAGFVGKAVQYIE
jgi:hypothetical protein